MVWLLSVWESFLVKPRGTVTIAFSATIRKTHVRLLEKRVTWHGYAPMDIQKSNAIVRQTYKASCIPKHY
jgi:hypothetical protein